MLVFCSHSSVNVQLILECSIRNFRLKYEDSENIEADPADTVVFKLHQLKLLAFLLGHPVEYSLFNSKDYKMAKSTMRSIEFWSFTTEFLKTERHSSCMACQL